MHAVRSWATVAGIALAVGLLIHTVPELRRLEKSLGDTIERIAAPTATLDPNIVLVAVDEATLATLPFREPVSRALLADVITTLAAMKVAAIGVDILLDTATLPEDDQALHTAIRQTDGIPVVLAYAPKPQLGAGVDEAVTDKRLATLARFAEHATLGDVRILIDDDSHVTRTLPATAPGKPLPFSEALLNSLGLPGTRDGLRLVYRFPESWPSGPASSCQTKRLGESTGLRLPLRFPCFSALAVKQLGGAGLHPFFEGRIALIGADLVDKDQRTTIAAALAGANDGTIPGVEVHAHAIAQQLYGWSMRDAGLPATLAIALGAAALAFLVTVMDVAIGVRVALLVLLGFTIFVAMAALIHFAGLRLPLLTAEAALAATAAWTGIVQWREQHRHRLWLRNTFSRYLAPAVVERLDKTLNLSTLEGERSEITCIFTDVQGFTGLSERLEPTRLVSILNRYLDGMSARFFAHGATVDKFVGDAVVGFIGAPLANPDHAAAALRLVRDLDQFAEAFRADMREEGIEFGVTRIGVNSGSATVGNFGGEKFFDYTAMGDAVNTAARLEGANSFFGTRICASASTVQAAGDPLVRRIGPVVVKGRTAPLELYEVLASEGPALAYRDAYGAALDAIGDDPAAALAGFDRLAAAHPEDPLVRFHRDRLAAGVTTPLIRLEEKSA